MTTERVAVKASQAKDIERLVNRMFAPPRAEGKRTDGRARVDDSGAAIVLTGSAEDVAEAKELMARLGGMDDLENTSVFFFARLSAAKAEDMAPKPNARYTTNDSRAALLGTTMAGTATSPFGAGHAAFFVANPDTNSVLVTCDVSKEREIRDYIKKLDDAAVAGTKPASKPAVAATTGAAVDNGRWWESQPGWSEEVGGLRVQLTGGKFVTPKLGMEVDVRFWNTSGAVLAVAPGDPACLRWEVRDVEGKVVTPEKGGESAGGDVANLRLDVSVGASKRDWAHHGAAEREHRRRVACGKYAVEADAGGVQSAWDVQRPGGHGRAAGGRTMAGQDRIGAAAVYGAGAR